MTPRIQDVEKYWNTVHSENTITINGLLVFDDTNPLFLIIYDAILFVHIYTINKC